MRIKNSFLFGLLTGVGIGYYLASDDKDELIERVKDTASQARDVVEGGIEKGRKLIDDMKTKKNEG